MRLKSAIWTLLAGGLLLSGSARAALQLSEIFVNAPGGGDNGYEFVEVAGDAAESLNDVWFLIIEGGGTAAGTVDLAMNLGALAPAVGANGLLLVRDSATVFNPAPDAATVVAVSDFNPDIENGTQTYLLVIGFTGAVGTDYDADNDANLDSTPWTAVLDAVGVTENAGELLYADDLGGFNFGDQSFTPDWLFRDPRNPANWGACDVVGANPGPYAADPTNVSDPYFNEFTVADPGNVNVMFPVTLSDLIIE